MKETNSEEDADLAAQQEAPLQEGVDYYFEDGLMVFTGAFLRRRGHCCKSGCRHCPYEENSRTRTTLDAFG